MKTCPSCQSSMRQVKNGRTSAGRQRYWGRACGRKYTPSAKTAGDPPAMRAQATRMYVDGSSLRWIARHRGVVHQTVAHWVSAQADAPRRTRPGGRAQADAPRRTRCPPPRRPAAPPPPTSIETAELDALYTFVTQNKTVPTVSQR